MKAQQKWRQRISLALDDVKLLRAICYPIIFLISVYYLWNTFGLLHTDSMAYINNSIIVTPVYPIFIGSLQFIFGEENYKMVTICQYVFAYFTLCYACINICKIQKVIFFFEVQFFLIVLIFFINIKSYYLTTYSFASTIMTEAISYPLFFLVVAKFLDFYSTRSTKSFLYLVLFSSLLFSIRAQFIILYPMILGLVLLIGVLKGRGFKAIYIAIILAAALFTQYIPNFYNYYKFGLFTGSKGSGISLSNNPFYLARPDDKELFKDVLERQIFERVYAAALEHNSIQVCDIEKWKKPDISESAQVYSIFSNNWNIKTIVNIIKFQEVNYQNSLNKKEALINADGTCTNKSFDHFLDTKFIRILSTMRAFYELNISDWKAIDPILTKISFKLIKKHFKEWVMICLSVFITYLGAFCYIFIPLFVYLILTFNPNKTSQIKFFITLILAIHIFNALFISFVGVHTFRYSIYTYSLLAGCMVIGLQRFYERYLKK